MGRAESTLLNRMIFNFGAQRSGTFWLQRIVTAHPAISSIPSETSLFSHGIAPLLERFHHGARSSPQVGAIYIERDRLIDALRDLCDSAFAPYLDAGAEFLAERTAVHVRHVGLIAEVYPDARFIHIIRDGRDVVRSHTSQSWGHGSISAAAEEWRASILAARDAGLPSDRYREIRYETLMAEPKQVIADLYSWLDLPTTDEVLEHALSEARVPKNVDLHGHPGVAAGKWQGAFSAKDLAEFERVAGVVRSELGYPVAEARRIPSTRREAARKGLRRLRGALGSALNRTPSHPQPRSLQPNLRLGDRAIHALIEGRPDDLTSLMAPDALVKVVSSRGTETQRGVATAELLARTIRDDPAFAGRQSIGDIYPGNPVIGYVLTFEQNGHAAGDRAVFITIGDGRISELAVYALR
jgi:hypothetical protein